MDRLCITEARYVKGKLLEVKLGLIDGETNAWAIAYGVAA
jgi:hypothetical protein